MPNTIAGTMHYLSIDYHLSNISRGVIDSRNLIYFFSMIGLFLILTVESLSSRKWN